MIVTSAYYLNIFNCSTIVIEEQNNKKEVVYTPLKFVEFHMVLNNKALLGKKLKTF